MAKYVKKPVEIEAITFDELMRIGAENADTVVDCMPVKLMYNGYVIRQYDSNSYTIPTLEGDFLMTKDDMQCRDKDNGEKGDLLDIRDTKMVEYTLNNILSNEWLIAE